MQDIRKTLLNSYTPRELENAKAYSLTTFIEKLREKMVRYNFRLIKWSEFLEIYTHTSSFSHKS
jgi:hypothetical protein